MAKKVLHQRARFAHGYQKARESEAPSKDERVSIALQVRNVFHRVLEIPRLVNRVDIALFRPPMAASGFARDWRGQPGQVRQAARSPQLQLIPGLLPVAS